MRIDVHLHIEPDPEVLRRLDAISTKLGLVYQLEKTMADTIDDLARDVADEDTSIDAAVVLLNGIDARIAAAGVDPAKLSALRTDIQTKKAALAAAVIVGTPVAPAGAPVVTPAAATSAAAAAVAANPTPAA